MTLIPWKQGRCLVWDATVPDTLAPSHVIESAKAAGSAANKAEKAKVRKYSNLIKDFAFVPVAVETLGPYGPEAHKFIQELGRRLRAATGDTLALCHLRQRISVAIQRGNAIAVLGILRFGQRPRDLPNFSLQPRRLLLLLLKSAGVSY